MVKFIAQCQKCGSTRSTYNDPRLRRSVIECKAKCFESHYEWDYVEEIEDEVMTPVPAPKPASATLTSEPERHDAFPPQGDCLHAAADTTTPRVEIPEGANRCCTVM